AATLSPVAMVEALGLENQQFALLESGKGGEKLASHTFICYAPSLVYRTKGNEVTVNAEQVTGVHPYGYLEGLLQHYPAEKIAGMPKFTGGAVGFISYDMARFFEQLPELAEDDLQIPDLYFLLCERVIVIDNSRQTVAGIINLSITEDMDLARAYRWAVQELAELEHAFSSLGQEVEVVSPKLALENLFKPEANMSKERFEAMVVKAKEYIEAGDVFQVNLSIRLGKELKASPWQVYKVLRRVNPSPYASYINFGDLQLVGSSPELLVRIKDGYAETRPIAGTRRRGADREEDLALAHELINNEKERAEHIMLVDLERNDLGRVCDYGSVRVNELMVIEEYSHVMHIVSNVQGTLKQGNSTFDLLQAAFPGGTITGAPKVRCMEIIEELEPTRRGVYTGSVGYLGFGGEMEMNISIRTLVIKDGMAYVQAGAGIVADSVPEREYYESLKKAEALLRALELAEQG
ncbi:MAG TPA: anthranilate synthase component I family protein, partial [Verrucomicrobiae bacterium]|nr:anthranilate synthase component I family protein [Verrucomicrobiae bacterium]